MILKQKGMASFITGIGRGLANLEAAKRLGIVDSITRDVAEGVEDADLVVLAVPVMKMADAVRMAAPALKPGCIVTDVGSVKGAIIDGIEPLMPEGVHFVPGHPIAGTEHSGAEAAFPGLFTSRRCIITPTDKTDPTALAYVKAMWKEAGSEVVIMDAASHDRVLAAVSHLPHMIAYSLVNTVADMEDIEGDVLGFSAGGFRDFTRIASSSPEMWTDICAMNKGPIIEMIEAFQKKLDLLKHSIKAGDAGRLKTDFTRAKQVRDALVKGGNE